MTRELPVVSLTPDPMPEFVGTPRGDGRRFAVVASRFNESITRALADGAVDALVRHGTGFDDVDVVWVPGAWELPAAVRRVLASDRYAAVVAVGAVVRGETPHFDFVAGEAARGLADASAEADVPVALGLLTTDTMEQAEARAGGAHGNKGWDAALAALEMADLFAMLDAATESEDDDGTPPDDAVSGA
ncbi:6,7-dimethyl-8-ribityllumazine synthase [Gemmatimonadetes bacterium T265]|nr:6,7-dimethyl-8-ribityllumazine synthase [Gemmatimonadetes bacterium T265]